MARCLAVAWLCLPAAAALLTTTTPRLRQPRASVKSTASDGFRDFYALRFDGVRRLYGEAAPERLRSSRVVVVGLGGVGSWAVEALARSGVGALVLVDLDELCISNTNRQIHALASTVGRSKARELERRVAEINPDCAVSVREQWVLAGDASSLLAEEAAVAAERGETLALLDAVDGYREKAAMAVAAIELGLCRALLGASVDTSTTVSVACPVGLHVVLCGAAGGRSDPTLVRVADLVDVAEDGLLRSVRRELRKKHAFPPGAPQRKGGGQGGGQAWAVRKAARSRSGGGQAWGVPCVYSLEVAQRQPDAEGTLCDRFGTACFATGAFGFAAAAALTGALARGEKIPRRARRGSAAAVAEAAHRGGGGERRRQRQRSGAAELLPSEEASGGDLPLYDSHCHAIADAGALLAGPSCAGVCLVSSGEADWAPVEAAARTGARHALGVHPWQAHEQREGWGGRLREELLRQPTAAVGEAGLDRARRDIPWEVQLDAFVVQLRLASELRRPLVVHAVRSDGPLLDLLRAEVAGGGPGGKAGLPPVVVMHAFGGSAETALALSRLAEAAEARVYFGFSERAARLKRAPAAIQAVPAERLLIESDEHAADAACRAVRGACDRLAAARGWSRGEASERTARNALEAFDPSAWSRTAAL